MDKVCSFKIKGMQRDLSVSSFSAEYAYENMNIRIMPTNELTLLSVINEKGTKLCLFSLLGIPIGQATIDKYLIVFSYDKSSDKPDKITKISIDKSNGLDIDMDILYEGNLNFNPKCPIETLSFYENLKLMKVYWTDGLNLPRFINVASSKEIRNKWNDTSFDFTPQLLLKENVTITKDTTSGNFEAGVILYALTYYNKYGLLSNIFYISPIYYISNDKTGVKPSSSASNSFRLEVNNADRNFDYIRVYSIYSTTTDSNRIVRRVADIAISKNQLDIVSIVDNGSIGEAIADTDLLYTGSLHIIAGTFKDKDNTLFLGNLKLQKPLIDKATIDSFKNLDIIGYKSEHIILLDPAMGSSYEYLGLLNKNSSQITHFMYGETYRFGILVQDKYGIWSDPIYIKDLKIIGKVDTSVWLYKGSALITIPTIKLNKKLLNKISNFKKVRPVVVLPDVTNREIVCLGVLCPTVYSVDDRYTNTPYAQSSWFIRPNAPFNCPPEAVYEGATISNDELKYASYVRINAVQGELVSIEAMTDYSRGGIMLNSKYKIGEKTYETVNKGAWVEFRHNYPIPSCQKRNAEILCLYYQTPIEPIYKEEDSLSLIKYVTDYNNYYFVDLSIVTLHSPDIEFDPTIQSMDMSNLKLRIVGIVPITATLSRIDILTSTGTLSSTNNTGYGFYNEPIKTINQFLTAGNYMADSMFGWRGLVSGAFWIDYATNKENKAATDSEYNFVVYPWHRNGSLNNAKFSTDLPKPSNLEKKRLLNYRYSYKTQYFNRPLELELNTTDIKVFSSNEVTNIRLKGPEEIGSINYYGNIDKLITTPPLVKLFTINTFNNISLDLDGYPIFISNTSLYNKHDNFSSNLIDKYGQDNSGRGAYPSLYSYLWNETNNNVDYTGIDPVRMKYKSTPHAVIALNTSNGKLKVLPTFTSMKNSANTTYVATNVYYSNSITTVPTNTTNKSLESGDYFFYDKLKKLLGVSLDCIDLETYGIHGWLNEFYNTNTRGVEYGFLWLAQLYNDTSDSSIKFGGTSDEAIENNIWIPCGEAITIYNDDSVLKEEIILECSLGDTYYLRYDHIKTYPFSTEDLNQVTDIISFMCETRVNLDGRYDKNRGELNLSITPEVFNKINTVYSLTNNYFKYRTPNPNRLNINTFNNSITWTKTKTLGELIDSWANITLASTLDLDGDKGKVQALKRFNNTLFAFQDRGISLILYNENVLIASTQGVPIEIANSSKVSGKRYLTEVGCTNKWSICQTPNGIYFIDDITKGIYLFNGSIDNISDKLGFHSWINSESKSTEPWNPVDFGNFISYYDKVNGDVFFISKDKCLGFSEPLALFTSFYSYENTPYFANIEDNGLWIKLDGTIWLHLEGEYNNFFGELKPFYTTIIANQEPLKDKTFNTLEFRADSFLDNRFITKVPFDSVEVWNEYLRGISYFNKSNLYAPHNPIKQKFRIWRANIPRSNENYRDRIRNPWIYLKLLNDGNDNNKVLLHDMMVYYFE